MLDLHAVQDSRGLGVGMKTESTGALVRCGCCVAVYLLVQMQSPTSLLMVRPLCCIGRVRSHTFVTGIRLPSRPQRRLVEFDDV